MDGTLLDSQHQLPLAHEQALTQLLQQQQQVVIATGRAYPGVKAVLAEKTWFEKMTCVIHNGAATFQQGIAHNLCPMSWQGIEPLITACRQLNIHFHYQGAQQTYVSDPDGKWQWVYDLHQIHPIAINHYQQVDEPLLKVCLMGEPEQFTQLINQYPQLDFKKSNQWTASGRYFVDITAQGVTKQQAVARLAKQWGYAPDQVVAFGDQDNDAALLTWAGLSFAMANGSAAAQQAATHIAPSSDQAGVAHCLKQHQLLV